MKRLQLFVAAGFLLAASCVQVDRPLVELHGQPEPVDSSRVPATTSQAEAQRELEKAYAQIQSLERQNADLKKDKERYKRERDDYKKQLKKQNDD